MRRTFSLFSQLALHEAAMGILPWTTVEDKSYVRLTNGKMRLSISSQDSGDSNLTQIESRETETNRKCSRKRQMTRLISSTKIKRFQLELDPLLCFLRSDKTITYISIPIYLAKAGLRKVIPFNFPKVTFSRYFG